MTRLFATRFQNSDTSAEAIKTYQNVMDARVRWALPGGVQRLEVMVRVRSQLEIYEAMLNHVGQRIALYSSWIRRPISGNIYEVNPVGTNQIRYIAFGAWRRHFDELDTTVYASTTTNDTVVETVLTDHVSIVKADYTNVQAAGTAVSGWQPADETGSYPGDVINQMADMSDSSNNVYDYWCVDEPFLGVTLRQYIPYFKARSDTATVNWRVRLRDLREVNLSRSITELRNDVTVYYGKVGGTATGGSATTLVDSGASFTTAGIAEGDSVFNESDSSFARVVSVDSNTQLTISTLTNGTANTFSSGNVYSINLQDLQPVNNADASPSPWVREYAEKVGDFTASQADQYGAAMLTKLNRPTQWQSFTVTSPTIRNSSGADVPLWEVIAQGGGYIQIEDLYSDATLFTASRDRITTFFITALDYSYADNALRVTVENPDTRLDSRLVRAGILGSEGAYT